MVVVRGPEKLNGKRIIAVEDTTCVVTKTKPEKNSGLLFFSSCLFSSA